MRREARFRGTVEVPRPDTDHKDHLSHLTHTQPCRSGTGGCAFRPIRGADGAHKSCKNLAIRTAHAIRSRDDANRGRGSGIALRAGRTGCANWSLRSGRAALASRSGGTLSASLALRTLRSHGSRRTWWAGRTAFAIWALWADGSLRALCALRTCWTNRTGRTGLARGTRRTLRPWITAATRQRKDRDESAHVQQLAHGWFPPARRARLHCAFDRSQCGILQFRKGRG